MAYNVLVSLEDNNIADPNDIKIKVNSKRGKILGSSNTNDNGEYIVYTGTLEKSPNRSVDDNKSETINIRLWLKEDVSEEEMGKVFKA